MLPPTGWADVATRDALRALEGRLDRRFEALEHTMDANLQRGLREQTRTFFIGMLTVNATLASVAFAAARLV